MPTVDVQVVENQVVDIAVKPDVVVVGNGDFGGEIDPKRIPNMYYEEDGVVHKIDEKFLPDDVGGAEIDSEIFQKDIIIPETSLTMTEYGVGSKTTIHSDVSAEIGKTYIVNWNGIKYNCVAKESDSGRFSDVVLGNGVIFGLPSTDDPFTIRFINDGYNYTENVEFYSNDYLDTVAVEITTHQTVNPKYIPDMYYEENGEVHKVPEKYLPESINGKDGTSVTITNVSQSSADGGSNVVTFSDGKKLTVKNGSKGSTGKDGVSPTVAVSKTGKVTTIKITDVNGTKTATINDGADGSGGSGGGDPGGTIDPTRIPDMYYTEERQDVEILPTSTAINTGVSVMGEKYVIGNPITLVEGKTYKVNYNGVEYESIASVVTIQSINDGIGLGDVGILATGSPSGNYPFVLIVTKEMAEQGASVAVISLDGASSITVSIVGYGEIAHKIPEKYLPDNVLAGTINIETGMSALLEDRELRATTKEFADRVRGVARNCYKMLLIGDNHGSSTEFLLTKTQKIGIGDNNYWEFGVMFSLPSDETIIPYYISLRVNDIEDVVEIKVTALTPSN